MGRVAAVSENSLPRLTVLEQKGFAYLSLESRIYDWSLVFRVFAMLAPDFEVARKEGAGMSPGKGRTLGRGAQVRYMPKYEHCGSESKMSSPFALKKGERKTDEDLEGENANFKK